MIQSEWLPVVFLGLVGLSVFVYAILDGYDLGVGIMLSMQTEAQEHRNQMIASIGPFWDANETWLVLAVGLVLIAFPGAHNLILKELYLPAAIMLIGLILRGVAFDFRAKAVTRHRLIWDRCFKFGSILTALTQGYMLGRYVLGFEDGIAAEFFAILSGFCVTAAYTCIGGAWLVMKTEDELQRRAAKISRRAGWLMAAGIIAISIVNPMVSTRIAEKWLSFPQFIVLSPIPILCAALLFIVDRYLKKVPFKNDYACWLPFVCTALIFLICFQALAYSFYPYVVPGKMTAAEAASAPESLQFILIGALLVVPFILVYTLFSYRVFWGKVGELKYH